MHEVCKVCNVYKVLLTPTLQASYPTSVGFIGMYIYIYIYIYIEIDCFEGDADVVSA